MKALKLELGEDAGAQSGKVTLKTPKGTRDYQPDQVQYLCSQINSISVQIISNRRKDLLEKHSSLFNDKVSNSSRWPFESL